MFDFWQPYVSLTKESVKYKKIPAITCDGKKHDFTEIAEMSTSFYAFFSEVGASKGIVLSRDNSIENVVVVVAAIRFGCNLYIVDSLKTFHKFLEKKSDALEDYLLIDNSFVFDFHHLPDPAILDKFISKQGIFHFFTSGSTGVPKCVSHFVKTLIENAAEFNISSNVTDRQTFLHLFPMTYMAGILNCLISPMLCGSNILLVKGVGAAKSLNAINMIKTHDIDWMWVNPSFLIIIIEGIRLNLITKKDLESVIDIFCGTAPLSDTAREEARECLGKEIRQSYGMTEILLCSVQKGDFESHDCGVFLPSVSCLIDPKTSELVISTPFIAKSVLDDQLVEHQPFEKFRTGDIAEHNERLKIVGRLKDLIIRGGVNISPFVIEKEARLKPDVRDACAIGIPDRSLGEKVCLAYVANDDSTAELDVSYFDDCKIDYTLKFQYFPMTGRDKLDRVALREYAIRILDVH